MSLPAPASPRSILQLCCVVFVALAIPAALFHSGSLAKWLRLRDAKLKDVMRASAGIQDAAGGQAALQADRPEWVLVGNSMLNCRVDADYLEQLSGYRVFKLSFSGTKSAMWFLMLKTIVVPSGVKPKCVSIFFRDRDMTQPALRVLDNHEMIERLGGRQQPEWNLVMGDYDTAFQTPWSRLKDQIAMGMDALLPGDKMREWARGKLQKSAFNFVPFAVGNDEAHWRKERNAVLSMDHMRGGGKATKDEAREIQLEIAEKIVSNQTIQFDPAPEHSFLPHIVALAKQHDITLHFHRIKTNPSMPNPQTEAELAVPAYLAAMRSYLESHGCLYTDECSESEITASMYLDYLHIKSEPTNQHAFMKILWRNIQPEIDRVLKDSDPSPKGTP